ncbi:hypothetical protein AB0D66_28220 [Streptomyces sp. NPDC048270]|uniref:hypothetical protein n=1 Tax=Streptomyces sp. NPDC048270 TaxID=3154615 RepID=UPI0033C6CDA9
MSEPSVFPTTVATLPFSYSIRIDPAGHAVFDAFQEVGGTSQQVGTFKAEPTEHIELLATKALKGRRVVDVTEKEAIPGTATGPSVPDMDDEPFDTCWVDVRWHTENGDFVDGAKVQDLRPIASGTFAPHASSQSRPRPSGTRRCGKQWSALHSHPACCLIL